MPFEKDENSNRRPHPDMEFNATQRNRDTKLFSTKNMGRNHTQVTCARVRGHREATRICFIQIKERQNEGNMKEGVEHQIYNAKKKQIRKEALCREDRQGEGGESTRGGDKGRPRASRQSVTAFRSRHRSSEIASQIALGDVRVHPFPSRIPSAMLPSPPPRRGLADPQVYAPSARFSADDNPISWFNKTRQVKERRNRVTLANRTERLGTRSLLRTLGCE